MSANPADEALERLNYFNGQRLAASDFRAEQGHHTGMRRVLNQSLYSPGIVTGLEVEPDPNDTHRVIVRPGLAFDHLGREIFITTNQHVIVMGAPSTTKGVVYGNILAVSYREQRKHPVSDSCAVTIPCSPCSGNLPWGAPSRIVAEAVFEFLDSFPSDDSGKVLLAQIELSKTCEVVRVAPGVRKYATPVKAQVVRSVSLEGEKDIDKANPKVLHFHVAGGYAEAITLYLRARKFSSLYYTEMGKHKHTVQVEVIKKFIDLKHDHGVEAAQTDDADHVHELLVQDDEGTGLEACTTESTGWSSDEIRGGSHHHGITELKIDEKEMNADHKHDADATCTEVGVTDTAIRAGNVTAFKDLKNLKVILDGTDVSKLITDQLEAKPGQLGLWAVLDLNNTSAINGATLAIGSGTDEIDLMKLGIELGIGPHTIELRTDEITAGGCVQYNLYVS